MTQQNSGLVGFETLRDQTERLAERFDSDWTMLTAFDPQRRGPDYVEQVLRAAGLEVEIQDAQSVGGSVDA